jgi:hypothetical protein
MSVVKALCLLEVGMEEACLMDVAVLLVVEVLPILESVV